MKTNNLFLLFLCLIFSPSLEASHILGGSVAYTHTTNDSFEIRLNIYADCSAMPAFFDDPAVISIYKGDNLPYDFVETLNVSPSNLDLHTVLQDDCVTAPFPFCITRGTYVFDINLPDIGETYHLVYQRCCMGPSFTNIINPENTGFSLTTEISSAALQANNDSPKLSDDVLFEVCAGEEFSFDLSAIDANADSLVYELCNPLAGAGMFGTAENPGDPSGCEGVMPNPACPPPFALISFILPTYSAHHPLGTNPGLQLDRYTGQITGTPEILGQFLAGVCIKEYINGEVVSMSRQSLVFWVDFGLNARELHSQPLAIYPNPAQETAYITLPEQDVTFELLVRNVNGEIIRNISDLRGLDYALPLNGLHGLYFLELRTEKQVYFGKLMAL